MDELPQFVPTNLRHSSFLSRRREQLIWLMELLDRVPLLTSCARSVWVWRIRCMADCMEFYYCIVVPPLPCFHYLYNFLFPISHLYAHAGPQHTRSWTIFCLYIYIRIWQAFTWTLLFCFHVVTACLYLGW
jgi:hypothetical protein